MTDKIPADSLLDELARRGFGVISGVPCSYLTPFINTVTSSPAVRYVPAANEGDAVAIAAGAWIGGQRGAVGFQNSGLGNAVNPLTSLTATLEIPVLVFTTWRGEPGGPADEPQHRIMGKTTPGFLELMEIPWERFPQSMSDLNAALDRAVQHLDTQRRPYAFIVPKGAIGGDASPANPTRTTATTASPPPRPAASPLDQDTALRAILAGTRDSDVLLATTGFTGRALYAIEDRPNQLYMVGSMGCVSSMALGLALTQPARRVIALDGDGAVLMRMGALTTIGAEHPANLVHVVLDNGVHDSTGAQATVSAMVDLPAVAVACGYQRALRVGSAAELTQVIAEPDQGPTLVHARTVPRADRKLPRPTITPAEVALRLREWLRT